MESGTFSEACKLNENVDKLFHSFGEVIKFVSRNWCGIISVTCVENVCFQKQNEGKRSPADLLCGCVSLPELQSGCQARHEMWR